MSPLFRQRDRACLAAAHRLPALARASALVVATTLSLAACMTDPSLAPGSGAPSYVPAASAPPALSAGSEQLAIGSWQWLSTEGPATARITAEAPDRYTIKFEAGGRALVRADCNRGSGSYEVNGNAMSFKPIAMTRMGCPGGTQDTQFLQALSRVNGYSIRGGDLVLTLSDGTMRFRHSP